MDKYIDAEIDQALRHHNACGTTDDLRAHIRARVTVESFRNTAFARVIERGRILTIDDYVNEIKGDSRFSSNFVRDTRPRIPKSDQAKVNANRDRIASGEVLVVDDGELSQ